MPCRLGKPKRAYPEGSAEQVFNYIAGKNPDKWTAADAAHDLLGFAMSHGETTNSPAAAVPRDADAVKELKAYAARYKREPIVNHSPPTWFIAFLLRFLSKLLTT